tara:strand:- start:413 stop:892 length:480 start_codon:yes stop_codon:yes gene_type:complete
MLNKNDFPSSANNWRNDIAEITIASYEHFIGESVVDCKDKFSSSSEALFHLKHPLLVHDTQSDPIFCYGNLLALKIFEYNWKELLKLPSRLSAEVTQQKDRSKMMKEIQKTGYAKGYSGIRITKTGKRIQIEDTTIWNLLGPNSQFSGQAALIKIFNYL